jgi:diguanylate cyclase (GGDEF)-like protein/PAS domain S-box-containing protein
MPNPFADGIERKNECNVVHEYSSSPVDDAAMPGVEEIQWLKALADFAPVAVIVEDQQGRVRSWNREAERLFGWSEKDVLGHTLPFGPDADRIGAERRFQRVLEGEHVHVPEVECVRQDGIRIVATVHAVPVSDRSGRIFGTLSMYSDVHAKKRAESLMILQVLIARALVESETSSEAVVRAIQSFCGLAGWSGGVHWVLDPSDGVLHCQDVWCVPSDLRAKKLVDSLVETTLGPQEVNALARRVLVRGMPVSVADLDAEPQARFGAALTDAGMRSAFAFPVRVDGDVLGVLELFGARCSESDPDLNRIATHIGVLLGQHISRRETERRLQFVVSHDPLTGLPNRTIFAQRLGQALAQAARYDHKVALLFIDLDRFKVVNDTMGHEAGDRLLREVADRLRESLREGDTVARHGGDEFVVLIEQYDSAIQLAGVAQKIIDQAGQPYVFDGHEFHISASIGIATYPNDGQDSGTLFKHADIAMYRAKEAGKNQYQFYSPHMNRLSLERLEMENALRHALERGEFILLYQPFYDMEGRQLLGMEALLRWKRPGTDMVLPGEFMSLAEETGLAVHIGEWVLRTACAQARMWQDRGLLPVRVAVNVSARHFAHGNLVGCVDDVLRATHLDPALLQLEIREPMLTQNGDRALRVLRMLKELGVRIAIDDFGTGLASLDNLRRFPVDLVKLDRSFVASIPQAGEAASIARAVISMAHSFNLHAVAEGVETEEQARFLRIQGCDEMQGHLFAVATAPEQASEMLQRPDASSAQSALPV